MSGISPAINAALQPFVERQELAGAVVLVADKEQILEVTAVGYADIEAQQAMPTDAMFWIASQTKSLTATALMILVDEGQVQLDAAVEMYLPEFRGQMMVVEDDETHRLLKPPPQPITVRQVLNHTSGLPFASPLETPTLDRFPLEARVRSYTMLPLQCEPGSRYQYSNEGTNTVGRIIEIVAQMPYETFLQQRLLEPLGMTDTTFWPNQAQLSRLARDYQPNADGSGLEVKPIDQLRYPLDDHAQRYAMPAGGLFSTANDVARFCQMILNGGTFKGQRYLSPEAVQQMTSKQTGDLEESYGLGWATGDGWCGHSGACSTKMTIDTQRGLILLFLVQHDGFPGQGNQSCEAFQNAAHTAYAPTNQP